MSEREFLSTLQDRPAADTGFLSTLADAPQPDLHGDFNRLLADDPPEKRAALEEKAGRSLAYAQMLDIQPDQAFDMEEEIKRQISARIKQDPKAGKISRSGTRSFEYGYREVANTIIDRVGPTYKKMLTGLAWVMGESMKADALAPLGMQIPEEEVKNTLNYRIGMGLSSWGRKGSEAADLELREIAKDVPEELRGRLWDNPELLLNPKWQILNAGDAAVSLVPTMAAYLVGGPVAAGTAGGSMEGIGLYDDLRKKGVSHDKALLSSTAFGIVSGILNAAGMEAVLGKKTVNGLLSRMAHGITSGAWEGITEYLEEPFQAAFGGIAEEKSLPEIIKDVGEALKNVEVAVGSFWTAGAAGTLSPTAMAKEEAEPTKADLKKIQIALETGGGPLATKTPVVDEKLQQFIEWEASTREERRKQRKIEIKQRFRDLSEMNPYVSQKTEEEMQRDWAQFEAGIGKEAPVEGKRRPFTPALAEFQQATEGLTEEEKAAQAIGGASEILAFIRKAGGINPALAQGEMERFTYKEAGTTRLANPQGLAPDAMREQLQEAGFLEEGSTVNDMFDLMEIELHRYIFGKVMADMPIAEAMEEKGSLEFAIEAAEKAIRKAEAGGLREGILQEKARKKALEEKARARTLVNAEITRMAQQLRKIKPERMAPQYGEEVAALLEGIDLVRLNKPATLRLTRTREFLNNHPEAELPDYMLDKIARLDKTNVKDISFTDLQDIYTAIMHLAHLDRTLKEIKVGRLQYDRMQAVSDAIAEMKPAERVVEETIRFQEAKKNRTVQAIVATLGIRQDHYDLIVESLAGPNSAMDKVLYQGVKEGIIRQIEYRQRSYRQFMEDLAAASFTVAPKEIASWLAEEVTTGRFTLTRGERMALFRHSLNQDNITSLLSEGFGFKHSADPNRIYQIEEAELQEILTSLTEDELRFAGRPVQNLFENQYLELNDIFYEKNGYPLPKEDNYFPKEVMPLSRGEDFEKQEALERFRGQFMRIGLSKGMLEKRVRVRKPVYLNPITYDINKSIMRSGAYIGLEMPLSNASRLLYDKDFRRELSARYGEQTWKEIEKGLRDIAGEWQDYTITEELFRKGKNKMTTAMLSLSWAIPKQVLSAPFYLTYVKSRYWLQGMINTTFNYEEVKARHKLNSPEFTERAVAGGMERDVADVFKAAAEQRLYGGKGPLPQRMMGGLRYFDLHTVAGGMEGAVLQVLDELEAGELSREPRIALKWELEQLGKPLAELTPAEKMHLAYKFADFITERTQDIASPEHRSALSRGTTAEQFFTWFGSTTNQMLNMTKRSFREWRRTGDKEAFAKFAKALFLIFVVNTLGEMGIDVLREKLYGRKTKRSFLGRLAEIWASPVFFVRDIVRSAVSKIERGSFAGFDIDIPILRIPDLLIEAVVNGFKAATEEAAADRKKAAVKFIDAALNLSLMLKGLPYETPKRFLQGITGIGQEGGGSGRKVRKQR